MAKMGKGILSTGGTVTHASGFEGDEAEAGQWIALTPTPGPASIAFNPSRQKLVWMCGN